MWKTAFPILLLCLLAGDIPKSVAKSKLDVIEDKADCRKAVTTLLVFLPGIHDTPQDIVRRGFVSALRERRIAADVVLADAHIAYYTQGVIVQRLHDDIIAPARRKGYQQVWLAGISLGGYGALHYTREHADLVTGMMLIAPYLGEEDLLQDIARAGGIKAWQGDTPAPARHDRRLWSWLKAFTRPDRQTANPQPAVYLGYGRADKFAAADQMLASTLPVNHVITTEGGHTWQPWQHIWAHFLDRPLLPRCE